MTAAHFDAIKDMRGSDGSAHYDIKYIRTRDSSWRELIEIIDARIKCIDAHFGGPGFSQLFWCLYKDYVPEAGLEQIESLSHFDAEDQRDLWRSAHRYASIYNLAVAQIKGNARNVLADDIGGVIDAKYLPLWQSDIGLEKPL